MYDLPKELMLDYDRVDADRYLSLVGFVARTSQRRYVDVVHGAIERALGQNERFGDTIDTVY